MKYDCRHRVRRAAGSSIRRFLRDADGAITVDWVVLTAVIIFSGMAATFYVATSVPQVAEKVEDSLGSMTVLSD